MNLSSILSESCTKERRLKQACLCSTRHV
jgi:hypothetical protein